MDLEEFNGTGIWSVVQGIKVTIIEVVVEKVVRCRHHGMFEVNIGKKSKWVDRIYQTLHARRPSHKTSEMKDEHKVLHKLIFQCFMPWEEGTNKLWDHNHFLHFLINKFKINLLAYIFHYMCESIKEGIKGKKQVPYTRLLSEIFHQGKSIQKLQNFGLASDEELGTYNSKIITRTLLGSMGIIKKKEVITLDEELQVSFNMSAFLDDFPLISKEDCPEVLAQYISQHYLDTSVIISWDEILYNLINLSSQQERGRHPMKRLHVCPRRHPRRLSLLNLLLMKFRRK